MMKSSQVYLWSDYLSLFSSVVISFTKLIIIIIITIIMPNKNN